MPSGWDSKPTGVLVNDIAGDVFASNETSKVLESGTNGLDATFTGNVTGNVGGNVTGNITGDIKAADGSTILDSGATDDASSLKAAIKALNDAPIIGSIASAGQTPLTIDDTIIRAFEIKAKASGYLDLFAGDNSIVGRLGFTWGTSFWRAWVCAQNLDAIIESILSPQTTPSSNADVQVQARRISAGSGLGYDQTLYYRTGNSQDLPVTASAFITSDLNIPVGSRLIGAHIQVSAALAAGDLWSAEWNDGSTLEVICTAQAVAFNTKVAKLYAAVNVLTDAVTEVKISKNGGGNFTAQGQFKVVGYFEAIKLNGNF